ncbi:ABC transporter permease subunit [Nodularia spumigena CS-584]|jgi:general L-amino acid transport system permease protein|uniref:General L-amino acid transport system permease protein n=2 Tax=Nodularia spumigena TaxID=70799 RepID=A0A2S0Q9F0_NODSP|nr:ABC transporter permease subunit [Nodularia spumigena]AHJ31412.1 General L-amino acid transport system permease protein aapQ [Nodularia spumigena CCY9414]AVZ30997.1 general L-amino acid transport system permease protein [Nodularia spumigena UHCC 0039]EAW45810.1 permease protein of amino acid ABC transporter [Nodularia spumigena CCY9414]MDB9384045.1 ABC transporter permease subunit [Nodularia spumigena CS-584]MEA5526982.1 ABC transporter permease subunit [Nodularia spumigena UHCC 0143]
MTNSKPPVWRDYRFWNIVAQLIAVSLAAVVVIILWGNLNRNLQQLGIQLGFDFLQQQASFGIGETLINYQPTDTYSRALWVGLVNSLRVAVLGIFFTTIVGISAGIARLSDNWLVRKITTIYVEIFRNTPLLLQLLFWYFAVFLGFPRREDKISLWGFLGISQDGIELPWFSLSPEFSALLLGLVFFTGAFIAEIVRGGIQSVPKGQWEAARSLGFPPLLIMRLVIFPQALRVIIPPLTSQYLNLTKNSSLAIAIGYPDIYFVASTTFNQTGRAVEVMLLLILTYLTLSLTISLTMNLFNRQVQIK